MIDCPHFGINTRKGGKWLRGQRDCHLYLTLPCICLWRGTLSCTCEEQTSICSLNRQSAIWLQVTKCHQSIRHHLIILMAGDESFLCRHVMLVINHRQRQHCDSFQGLSLQTKSYKCFGATSARGCPSASVTLSWHVTKIAGKDKFWP